MILSTVIAVKIYRPLGIILFVGGCYAAKRATRKDSDVIKVAMQAIRLKPIYDPIKRSVK